MAQSVVRALATDPLRSFKYNVVIPLKQSNALTGQSMARLGFMSVSGLGIAIEQLTYREGGDNLTPRKMPGQADFNALTLSRGLFAQDNDNWEWMTMLYTAMYGAGSNYLVGSTGAGVAGIGSGPNFRTNMYINVLQHPNTSTNADQGQPGNNTWPAQNIVQVSFQLFSAWIGTLAYSDFDAGGNAVAVEQMTINYEGFAMAWGGVGAQPYVQNPASWDASKSQYW